MTTTPDLLTLRVKSATWEAQGVLAFELVPLNSATPLPPFEAGAHINLYLGGSLARSYSLHNLQSERHRYVIGVNLDAKSRGGSRHMHQVLRVGETLKVTHPANNFRLKEDAAHSVLIAGGIGVTPILGMARRLTELAKPWQVIYAARSRANAAFVEQLQTLAAQAGAKLHLHFDDEQGGKPLDMVATVGALASRSHAYCCGPLPMLAAFEAATAAWPREQVHLEYFSAPEAAAVEGGFTVELARSKRTVTISSGNTILEALLDIGIEPPFSCQQGICGTCEVRVLEGIPDHRDLVLSDAEKNDNDRMMICCSGSKTPKLVLDL
jgi:tetrachlorobenzoquinone reductase